MRPRLLLVAYELPPRWGPHALRLAYFCKHLVQIGWDVDAVGCLASPGTEDPSLAEIMPSCVNALRLASPRVPKGSAIWAMRALSGCLRIARRRRSEVIFSSAPQFVSHMTGYLAASRTGLPWVADYGDPFAYNPFYRRGPLNLGRALRRAVERRWLNRAHTIVLTTEEAADNYRENFPGTRARRAVIPLGYDPQDSATRGSADGNGKPFRIVFAGSLHSHRPTEFLKGIVEACLKEPRLATGLQVEFIKADDVREEAARLVPERFRHVFCFLPLLPHQEAVARMRSASCLLVFGNHGGLQVPSKVFVYFGLRKPVLAVLGDDRDPLKRIIEQYNRGFAVPDSAPSIAEAVLRLHDLSINHAMRRFFSLGHVPELFWENLTRELDKVLRAAFQSARS